MDHEDLLYCTELYKKPTILTVFTGRQETKWATWFQEQATGKQQHTWGNGLRRWNRFTFWHYHIKQETTKPVELEVDVTEY